MKIITVTITVMTIVLFYSCGNKKESNSIEQKLSTNKEKWNTIPRTYSEIDTLREKFEREGQPEKMAILDDINSYVEEMEKFYNAV